MMLTNGKIGFLALMLLGSIAQAGKSLELDCRIQSSGSSIPSTVKLASGDVTAISCDSTSCPDAADWEITMNYNGKGYEDVSLEVLYKPNGSAAYTKAKDVKVGTAIEFAARQLKEDRYLSLACDVVKIVK